MTINNKIPIISLFTGGGFLDMGFEMAGFEVVWTNELNPFFSEMYSFGYSRWREKYFKEKKSINISFQDSIQNIASKNILQQAFGSSLPSKFGVIGGPPCQDFSAAGHNAGFNGKRGMLTKVFFKYVLEMAPSFFVMENVQNLVNNKDHKKHLSNILNKVKQHYFIDKAVLNAMYFGVPQDRNRLFIIGIRKKDYQETNLLEQEFCFPFPSIKEKFKDAFTKYNWPTIDKFQNGVLPPSGIPSELYINNCLLDSSEENTIANGNEYFKPYSNKFWEIEEGNTKNRSFKRLHRYRYSPTACYGNNEVHLHPYLPRRLSVREALRIQSVPDEYILPENIGLSQKFKMIGNGVPVNLAKEVAISLNSFLNKNP